LDYGFFYSLTYPLGLEIATVCSGMVAIYCSGRVTIYCSWEIAIYFFEEIDDMN